jgi:hypothetical protein
MKMLFPLFLLLVACAQEPKHDPVPPPAAKQEQLQPCPHGDDGPWFAFPCKERP